MGEVDFAIPESECHLKFCLWKDETVVNGGDVGLVVTNINDNAIQAIPSVELCHGSFHDGEPCDIEAFKEYLAYTLVGQPRKARSNGHEDRRLILNAATLELIE